MEPLPLLVATVLSLLIWAIGFYGILNWLQPRLFGGKWTTSGKTLLWWVAALVAIGCHPPAC